jgi:hypothetical protein
MDNMIGIIDARADGSYIYMSHKGILNLDSWKDLDNAIREDDSLTRESEKSKNKSKKEGGII